MIVRSLNAFALSGRHYISSCEPRASAAAPWVFHIVESPRPERAKALILKHIRLVVIYAVWYQELSVLVLKRESFVILYNLTFYRQSTGRHSNVHAQWLCDVLMLLPFQGVITFRHVNPGCRCACPGLCAPLGLQPALAKSEIEMSFCNHMPTR